MSRHYSSADFYLSRLSSKQRAQDTPGYIHYYREPLKPRVERPLWEGRRPEAEVKAQALARLAEMEAEEAEEAKAKRGGHN